MNFRREGKQIVVEVEGMELEVKTQQVVEEKPKLSKERYIKSNHAWKGSDYSILFERIMNKVHEAGSCLVRRSWYTTNGTKHTINQKCGALLNGTDFEGDIPPILLTDHWLEDEDNILEIATIAHELGHLHDRTENFNNQHDAYYGTLGTLEVEVRAWEYAVHILKEIGYTHWSEFNIFMKSCLGSYYESSFAVLMRDTQFGYSGGIQRSFEEAEEDIMSLTDNSPE